MRGAIVIRVLGYVVTVVCGVVAGGAYMFTTSTMPTMNLMRQSILSSSGHETYALYRYGSYQVAREALLAHLEVAKCMPAETSSLQAFEVMLTYGRLAIAAEKAGLATEAKAFFQQAIAAPLADGGRVTEAQVRETVASIDDTWDRRLSRDAEMVNSRRTMR
jgi:hypothetical protein